ncbi:MAG: hypothetical protein HUK22_02475, partial [Thermoguttaceae bacterium]|nr:hypothetical protein [Thermoguttaceae bacterium]
MKSKFVVFSLLALVFIASPTLAQELVFDFESGDLAADGWAIVSGVNSRPIGSRDVEFHNGGKYDKHGARYLTTLESDNSDAPTDDTICEIESPAFVISGDKISFLLGGAGRRPEVYVALALLDENGDAEEVVQTRGEDSQKLREITWDVAKYRGRRAVIRVVDQTIGPWAHIRCDYFRVPGEIDSDATALRREFFAKAEAEKERKREEIRRAAFDSVKNLGAPILYVRRAQYRPDHHNTATIFQKGEINEASFVGGTALVVW